MSGVRYWLDIKEPDQHATWPWRWFRLAAERTELRGLTVYRCVSMKALRELDVDFVIAIRGPTPTIFGLLSAPECAAFFCGGPEGIQIGARHAHRWCLACPRCASQGGTAARLCLRRSGNFWTVARHVQHDVRSLERDPAKATSDLGVSW